jgi:hypothetical protein
MATKSPECVVCHNPASKHWLKQGVRGCDGCVVLGIDRLMSFLAEAPKVLAESVRQE